MLGEKEGGELCFCLPDGGTPGTGGGDTSGGADTEKCLVNGSDGGLISPIF